MRTAACLLKWWYQRSMDEHGQGTVEYVLLILGVVLFLLVAAFALQGVLSNAIVSISSWIAGQNPP